MTYVKRAQRFARGRRWLTAGILAIIVVTAFAVTAAVGANGKGNRLTAPKIANGLLRAAAIDSCGYSGTTTTFNAATPYSSYGFNESTVLKGGNVIGIGQDGSINAFYSDEHALTLGVGATSFSAAAAARNYGTATNPASDAGNLRGTNANGSTSLSIGNPAAIDPLHRPIYPAAFVTDQANANPKAGDWQNRNTGAGGGVTGAQRPDFVAGTWKDFNPSATVADPGKGNGTNLGTVADPFVTNITGATKNEAYGSEISWNVKNLKDENGNALQTGHRYRVQFIVHDGDQNKTGGDVGEACVIVTIPGPPPIATTPSPAANPGGNAHISQPLGSTINDTARLAPNPGFPNVTGNVTFNLYFVPAGQNPANPCAGPAVFTDTKALTPGNPSTATSGGYDTTGKGFGTYYWQDSYDPNGDPNYTAATDVCGAETDQMVDAHIRLTPHEATNVLGNDHTVTAFVESTTDGTNFSNVSGASVDFTISGSASGAGPNSHLKFHPTPGTPCTTATGCTTTITDDMVEDATIHASSTNFSVAGVLGTFTKATGGANNTCVGTPGQIAECGDAIKHWINPKTNLIVSDQLGGLGSSATGTVEYTAWIDDPTCAPGASSSVKKDLGSTSVIVNGLANPSPSTVTVEPGHTVYFQAHYVGNEGTITTTCTAEQASSAS